MSKIVFIEDDHEMGGLIATYLSRHDIEVIVESRKDHAEQIIAWVNPDLVILDITLLEKEGRALCRDLRV